jgi:hypothetical protein
MSGTFYRNNSSNKFEAKASAKKNCEPRPFLDIQTQMAFHRPMLNVKKTNDHSWEAF